MPDVASRVETWALPDPHADGRLADARRLVVRTVVDTFDDRVPGLAAEMAFYIVLSLPPLLLVVLGSVGFVVEGRPEADVAALQEAITDALGTFLTPETVAQVLEGPVAALLRDGRSDIVSLGIVLTLWSASRSTNVVLRTVVIAYDVPEQRAAWRRRGLALAMTLAGIATAVVVLPLLVIGPDVARDLLTLVGLDPGLARVFPVLYWTGVALLAVSALTWLYHVAPGFTTPWRRDLPGAVLAFVVWVGSSAAVRVYVAEFAGFTGGDFRGLAAPLVLLVWVYASGIAVLLGAEFNAEIEKLWPTPDGPYDHTADDRRGDPPSAAPDTVDTGSAVDA
ncbi:YihY/virulence factor BrkB family protein [Salsipaludibacter albus]|uniref:YihY/virulence factor BrkB family protein n=1 Tax=Salsipaludibacter albus TaxID=2849650 RepID=UPI001EE3D685|nr:YihY/virulence factor BrkB family protein [Salsipaludibacter albus]